MAQGRQAVYDLLEGSVDWPPVVIPFGVDPFGWHGEQESYREICDYALENCTLFPKVYPFSQPLAIGNGDITVELSERSDAEGSHYRKHTIKDMTRELSMEEVQTAGDSSWKNRSRWIESEDDLVAFLDAAASIPAPVPDIEAVREKERRVGDQGLPYIETPDPFYTVCEMFPTEDFFVRTLTDNDRLMALIDSVADRMLAAIETLCRDAGCPFILRLIGAEMAAPPFMSRDDFLRYEGRFYRTVSDITHRHGVPASFHSHGPVRGIINDVWEMGYEFMEPFEPPPNGNLTIAEALEITGGRGIVFGGVDDVVINSCTPEEVRQAVKRCLKDARGTNRPYIVSQSSTPFHDPLPPESRENYLIFMQTACQG